MSSRKFRSGKYTSAKRAFSLPQKDVKIKKEAEYETDVDEYVKKLKNEIQSIPREELFLSESDITKVRSMVDDDTWFDLGVGSYENFVEEIAVLILQSKETELQDIKKRLKDLSEEKSLVEKNIQIEDLHMYGLTKDEIISSWEEDSGYIELIIQKEQLEHDITGLKAGFEQKGKY